jgi:hypothetical protein
VSSRPEYRRQWKDFANASAASDRRSTDAKYCGKGTSCHDRSPAQLLGLKRRDAASDGVGPLKRMNWT